MTKEAVTGPGPARAESSSAADPADSGYAIIVAGARAARSRTMLSCILLVPVLVASLTAAVSFGAVGIAPSRVWSIVFQELLGRGADDPLRDTQIVWQLRVPRALLAAICGAGLAVVGVAIQTLVRNPLADPYVLGVSSGASVGAVAVILFGIFSGLGMWALSAASFVGALVAVVLVYSLASAGGQLTPLRLVLTGVAVAYVLSSLTSFLIFQGDDRGASTVLTWLLGSFGRARWEYLLLPTLVVVAGTVWLVVQGRRLDALLLGEETAATLGVDVRRLRRGLFVVTALITGSLVAVAGAVGFVGLVLPHLTRLVVGAVHRRVLPLAALLGACSLTLADLACRTLVAPEELPVGVLTGLVGGPVFVWMMHRRATQGAIR